MRKAPLSQLWGKGAFQARRTSHALAVMSRVLRRAETACRQVNGRRGFPRVRRRAGDVRFRCWPIGRGDWRGTIRLGPRRGGRLRSGCQDCSTSACC